MTETTAEQKAHEAYVQATASFYITISKLHSSGLRGDALRRHQDYVEAKKTERTAYDTLQGILEEQR